jgi:hypothetical protein
MNLDDILNNKLKHPKKKKRVSCQKIIQLILDNKYDPSNPTHVRMKNRAVEAGVIDENLNIIERR